MSRDIATEVADDGVAPLISSPSATFEQAFAVENDAVFDEFLAGPVGSRKTS